MDFIILILFIFISLIIITLLIFNKNPKRIAIIGTTIIMSIIAILPFVRAYTNYKEAIQIEKTNSAK